MGGGGLVRTEKSWLVSGKFPENFPQIKPLRLPTITSEPLTHNSALRHN